MPRAWKGWHRYSSGRVGGSPRSWRARQGVFPCVLAEDGSSRCSLLVDACGASFVRYPHGTTARAGRAVHATATVPGDYHAVTLLHKSVEESANYQHGKSMDVDG